MFVCTRFRSARVLNQLIYSHPEDYRGWRNSHEDNSILWQFVSSVESSISRISSCGGNKIYKPYPAWLRHPSLWHIQQHCHFHRTVRSTLAYIRSQTRDRRTQRRWDGSNVAKLEHPFRGAVKLDVRTKISIVVRISGRRSSYLPGLAQKGLVWIAATGHFHCNLVADTVTTTGT
jgi:hypothetical protein